MNKPSRRFVWGASCAAVLAAVIALDARAEAVRLAAPRPPTATPAVPLVIGPAALAAPAAQSGNLALAPALSPGAVVLEPPAAAANAAPAGGRAAAPSARLFSQGSSSLKFSAEPVAIKAALAALYDGLDANARADVDAAVAPAADDFNAAVPSPHRLRHPFLALGVNAEESEAAWRAAWPLMRPRVDPKLVVGLFRAASGVGGPGWISRVGSRAIDCEILSQTGRAGRRMLRELAEEIGVRRPGLRDPSMDDFAFVLNALRSAIASGIDPQEAVELEALFRRLPYPEGLTALRNLRPGSTPDAVPSKIKDDLSAGAGRSASGRLFPSRGVAGAPARILSRSSFLNFTTEPVLIQAALAALDAGLPVDRRRQVEAVLKPLVDAYNAKSTWRSQLKSPILALAVNDGVREAAWRAAWPLMRDCVDPRLVVNFFRVYAPRWFARAGSSEIVCEILSQTGPLGRAFLREMAQKIGSGSPVIAPAVRILGADDLALVLRALSASIERGLDPEEVPELELLFRRLSYPAGLQALDDHREARSLFAQLQKLTADSAHPDASEESGALIGRAREYVSRPGGGVVERRRREAVADALRQFLAAGNPSDAAIELDRVRRLVEGVDQGGNG